MTGWLIALAIIFLLAILPLGVLVKYNADGPLIRVIAGPLKITVFPMKKKEKSPKEKKEKPKKEKAKKEKKKPAEEPKKEKGGSVLDFWPLVKVALDFLGDFRRKLRIRRLELRMVMAGGDPADLALNCGKAWAAIGALFPMLERAFVIKKRNVDVSCDFDAEESTIYARVEITITLGRLITLGVRYAIRALRILLKILKTRKGGASK
ncbi:MAG: DUF2953 domain-containing protein [Ruminococcaceae bacterium]|nr:DUF2953 domain-containing protein [Oscillospiraceae bacterium]MBQ3214651.1 DUF2953 domain-containing protein [Oscillospiraceae bacterium]